MLSQFASLNRVYDYALNRPSLRLTVPLPGAGCQWKSGGEGCSMCGFIKATKQYSQGFLFPSFVFKSLFLSMSHGQKKDIDEIAIYNGGSFFNEKELPLGFCDWLLKKVSSRAGLRSIFLESRCDYLSEERLEKSVALAGKVKIVLGIGLESRDDFVRNKLLRKGLEISVFEKGIKLLQRKGIVPSAYVFLGAPGLTEKESFEDACRTIEYLVGLGVQRIDLSCAFVQEETSLYILWKEGRYKPPSLWTIVEIIKRAKDKKWPLRVGFFGDLPKPVATPANCDLCSLKVCQAIEVFRVNGYLGDLPDCFCKYDWLMNFGN